MGDPGSGREQDAKDRPNEKVRVLPADESEKGRHKEREEERETAGANLVLGPEKPEEHPLEEAGLQAAQRVRSNGARPEPIGQKEPVIDRRPDALATADGMDLIPVQAGPRYELGDIGQPDQPAVGMLHDMEAEVAELMLGRQDRYP